MKSFDFIQKSLESVKDVQKSLASANKEYTSISQVLKDMQRKSMMKAGYSEVFAQLGLPTDGSVVPAQLFGSLDEAQWGKTVTTKNTTKWVGLWGWSLVKNEDGTQAYEEDGKTKKREAKLRKVTSWTPSKVVKLVAQRNALRNQEA